VSILAAAQKLAASERSVACAVRLAMLVAVSVLSVVITNVLGQRAASHLRSWTAQIWWILSSILAAGAEALHL
jgi:hypothetical protein